MTTSIHPVTLAMKSYARKRSCAAMREFSMNLLGTTIVSSVQGLHFNHQDDCQLLARHRHLALVRSFVVAKQ